MAEEYQVGTPESVDISYEIAGIGSRFAAAVLDLLTQAGLILLVALGSVALSQLPEPGSTIGVILFVTLVFVVFWGYFIILETLWTGQTPGKRIMNVRVIKTSGHPIGFFEALIRNLLRIVDFLPSMYALGLVVMFVNSQSRRLGDLAAGTVAVKERPRVRLSELPVLPVGKSEGMPGPLDSDELAWELRTLTNTDLQIVADYLARSKDFPQEARDRVGNEIARMVAAKIGAREPLDPTPFLRRVLELVG